MDKTKKLTTSAMLAAIAYLVMLVSHVLPPVIPSAPFISYDAKDVIIVIGGFILGPLYSLLITIVVAFAEMLTISSTGPIGFIMNVIASASFCLPAAWIYSRKHTLNRAVAGLVIGAVLLTVVMVLWNYLLTPLYMDMPREAVAKMLVPVFIPINVFKGSLNTAFTLMLYKPIVTALRRSGLVAETLSTQRHGINAGVLIFSALIIICCVMFILLVRGLL